MAFTSDIASGGSDIVQRIELQAMGKNSRQDLPNLPKDDYEPYKGDLFKLHIKDFFGFTTCIAIKDIQRISILPKSDNWNIESIVTFAVINQNYWVLTSADLNVFQWIDANVEAYKNFTLSLGTSTVQSICFLYVMAYTTNQSKDGIVLSHKIELTAKGVTKSKLLPNLPGKDYATLKGDLWKLGIEDYFGFTGCITKSDIQSISILAGNNEGWHIDSVITFVAFDEHNWELSSVDLDANRWIDGDSLDAYKQFSLNLVI